MYQNKLNRQWNPCKICKWNNDNTTEDEYGEHCNKCNSLCSKWEESNEFKQFRLGVQLSNAVEEITNKSIKKEKIYPLIIMCTTDIKCKFLEINRKEAFCKYCIDIHDTDDLEYFKILINNHKDTSGVTPLLIVPSDKEFRDYIYSNGNIMNNWKVFTVFPNFDNPEYYIINEDPIVKSYKISKKEILDLKLDKRFDQIAVNSFTELKTDLYKLNMLPSDLIF